MKKEELTIISPGADKITENQVTDNIEDLQSQLQLAEQEARTAETNKDENAFLIAEKKMRSIEGQINKIKKNQELLAKLEDLEKKRPLVLEKIKIAEANQDEVAVLEAEQEIIDIDNQIFNFKNKSEQPGKIEKGGESSGEQLQEKAREVITEIQGKVGQDQEAEAELMSDSQIPGASEIDETRQEVVGSAFTSINLLIVENSLEDLQSQLQLAEQEARTAEVNKDESAFLIAEKKMKSIEGQINKIKKQQELSASLEKLEEQRLVALEKIKTAESSEDEATVLVSEKEVRDIENKIANLKNVEEEGGSNKNENIESLINQAKSFEELVSLIETKNISIQGSMELFTPEMLKNVILKIQSREWALDKATNSAGLRSKLVELLKAQDIQNIEPESSPQESQDVQKDDSEIEDIEDIDTNQDGLDATEDLDEVENSQESVSDQTFSPEVTNAFSKFNISADDLSKIPDFLNLNPGIQLLIARNLQAMSLEQAKTQVKQTEAQSFANKGFLGKIKQGFVNVFKKSGYEKEAISKERSGGADRHQENLTKLVDWAKTFNFQGEIKEGKFEVDFASFIKPEQLDEQGKVYYENFNKAANHLASLPKHWQEDSASEEEQKNYSQALDNYSESKKELMWSYENNSNKMPIEVAVEFNQADAQVNMLQFFQANPELEKEWNDFGKSKITKFLNNWDKNDKAKFFATGFAARSILTTTIGAVAIPLVAAGVGAWRGWERGKKKIKESDKEKSKNLAWRDHPLLKQRQLARQKYHELISNLDYKAVDYDDQLKKAHQDFYQADEKWQDFLGKNIDKKVEKSNDLTNKLNYLLNKLSKEEEAGKKVEILGEIDRRVKFNQSQLKSDLVHFGAIEERSSNMLDFYQSISQAQILLTQEAYNRGDLVWENLNYKIDGNINNQETDLSDNDKEENHTSSRVINMQERSQQILQIFEDSTEIKLNKNRKKFIIKKMVQGATIGAVFVSAGALTRDAFSGAQESISESLEASGMLDNENFQPSIIRDESEEIITNPVLDSSIDGLSPEQSSENIIPGGDLNESLDSPVTGEPNNSETISNIVQEKNIGNLSKIISNEGLKPGQADSVWRSAREIFMNNAEALGYEGDVNNAGALREWADNQVGNAISRSGDITDKVFEGNVVALNFNEAGEPVINIETGEGFEPGYLNQDNLAEKMVDSQTEPLQQMESRPARLIYNDDHSESFNSVSATELASNLPQAATENIDSNLEGDFSDSGRSADLETTDAKPDHLENNNNIVSQERLIVTEMDAPECIREVSIEMREKTVNLERTLSMNQHLTTEELMNYTLKEMEKITEVNNLNDKLSPNQIEKLEKAVEWSTNNRIFHPGYDNPLKEFVFEVLKQNQ